MLNAKNPSIQNKRFVKEVTNPLRKRKNLLMIVPKIMRTWLKSKSLEILNMMMKY
jgi:hypothetical protein